uniref:Carbohydrate kinase PfkB domain-containing protein n=1 Tax=Parascaris univalens TaxID=6257 RepID=A0A915C5Q2_PARUN
MAFYFTNGFIRNSDERLKEKLQNQMITDDSDHIIHRSCQNLSNGLCSHFNHIFITSR